MQTNIFIVLLTASILLFLKKKSFLHTFDTTLTNELKGAAILMVIFSHVGYFLTSDHTFLYPLSVAGGIGVNILLLLSGFGLTTSALKSSMSLRKFYFKRLKKIYIPMWVVLGLLFILDALVLGRHYGFKTVLGSLLGWFPRADVFLDIDSPLWYFTAILFYYLLFPLIFSKRQPFLSAILMLLLGCILVDLKLPVVVDVLKLYKLHYTAFPFGMLLAILLRQRLTIPTVASRPILLTVKFAVIAAVTYLFCYTAIHSFVGASVLHEQLISLLSVGCLLIVFFLKSYYSRFLTLLGAYSYEIYLVHWPLVSRYDFLYNRLPASLATFLYLVVLLVLGVALKLLTNRLLLIFERSHFGIPSGGAKN